MDGVDKKRIDIDGLGKIKFDSAAWHAEKEYIELELLREFFKQWERLHAFKGARELQMQCAQDLVDTAHQIRNLGKDDGSQKES